MIEVAKAITRPPRSRAGLDARGRRYLNLGNEIKRRERRLKRNIARLRREAARDIKGLRAERAVAFGDSRSYADANLYSLTGGRSATVRMVHSVMRFFHVWKVELVGVTEDDAVAAFLAAGRAEFVTEPPPARKKLNRRAVHKDPEGAAAIVPGVQRVRQRVFTIRDHKLAEIDEELGPEK